MINTIAQTLAFIMLLAGPIAFGILGKPTEMALCILAAAIALAFSNIEKIKRFKGAGFEAEMLGRKVEVMIAKEAEPEFEEKLSFTGRSYGLDDVTRNVVRAIGNSKYTWRTIKGLAQESRLDSVSIKNSINWLAMNDFVVQARTAGSTSWGLSEEGRDLYNSIKAF